LEDAHHGTLKKKLSMNMHAQIDYISCWCEKGKEEEKGYDTNAFNASSNPLRWESDRARISDASS